MAEKAPFRVEKEGHVAWLILDRPEKRNCMTFDFFGGLIEHFGRLSENPEVRVVVVQAEGKTFCAGLDLVEGAAILGDGSASGREKTRWKIRWLQDCISAVERCRKPVIAAVHGHCVGGGIDLTSACDIRLAARDAVFSIRETRIGIVADVGTLQRFPHDRRPGTVPGTGPDGREITRRGAPCGSGSVNGLYDDREALHQAPAPFGGGDRRQSPPWRYRGSRTAPL